MMTDQVPIAPREVIPENDPRLDSTSEKYDPYANRPEDGWPIDKGFIRDALAWLAIVQDPQSLEYEVRHHRNRNMPGNHLFQARCLDKKLINPASGETAEEALDQAEHWVVSQIALDLRSYLDWFNTKRPSGFDVMFLLEDVLNPERRDLRVYRDLHTFAAHVLGRVPVIFGTGRTRADAILMCRTRLVQNSAHTLRTWLEALRDDASVPERPGTRPDNQHMVPSTISARLRASKYGWGPEPSAREGY